MNPEGPGPDIEQTEDPTLDKLRLGLANDQKSFSQFVADSTSRLKSKALHILGNETQAEDVLQKLYLKLWDKRQDLVNRPLTWNFLYTIIRNQCLNEFRNQKIRKENYSIDDEFSEQAERPTTEPNPEKQVLLNEEINRVKQVIDKMHPNYQKVLNIQLGGGQTNQQISESTGFGLSFIRKALLVLRRKLSIKKRTPKPKPKV